MSLWFDPRRKRWLRLTATVVVVLVLLGLVGYRILRYTEADPVSAERGLVTAVTDGDSMRLSGGDRLRLANIDAPEQDEPLYDEARLALAAMADGRQLRLEYPNRRRDKYGRLLAYAYVDSVFVSEEMLRQGLAYLYIFDLSDLNDPRLAGLLEAQIEAIDAGRGLHGLTRHPETHYLATARGVRLHRPNCRSVRDLPASSLRVFESREDALRQGLSPCRRCRP